MLFIQSIWVTANEPQPLNVFKMGDALTSLDFVIVGNRRIAPLTQVGCFDNWEYSDSSPAVVDRVWYIGSGDKSFYAIDTRTGQTLWNFYAKSKVSSPPSWVAIIGRLTHRRYGGTPSSSAVPSPGRSRLWIPTRANKNGKRIPINN
jgi:hypothetical protein